MKKLKFINALLVAVMLIAATPARAEFNGERWSQALGMLLRLGDGCPAYLEDIMLEVIAEYAPIPMKYFGRLPIPPEITQDGMNVLYCSDTYPAQQAVIQDDPDIETDQESTVAGLAQWWFRQSTGEIIEADIWLRTSTLTPQTAYRFLTHEFMHAWGLQHDPDIKALMYYAPRRNTPHIYDLAELSRLYDQCENLADDEGNIFIAGVNMSKWILAQPPVVQMALFSFIDSRASFILEFATTYPDAQQRAAISNCEVYDPALEVN